MSEITLTIDGRKVRTAAGATVLDAAREAGIYIPTLCMDPLLKPFGACRLCIVEIEGLKALPSSCTTPAEDGMVVRTQTAAVARARRLALDLIIADHPLDCLTCRRNQRCELQKVAAYMGVTSSRLRPTRRQVATDTSNPFYDRDLAKCILCGRCVRACDEIRAVGAIAFINRSLQTKIGTAMDKPIITSNCESCGQCVDTCPTGALVDRKYAGLPDREVRTICPYCGCGCGVVLQVKGDRVVGAVADREHPVSKGSLCVKGRFGLDFVHHPDRLTKPLLKRDGAFVEASWDEALDLVAEKLVEHRGRFAALASAKCTNEDNYVFQKFTRGVMGTNNIDHCARICHAPTVAGLATSFGSGAMTNPISDLEKSGALLVIGSNTTETHPIAALAIKRAVREKGATLVVANPRYIELCRFAAVWLRQRPGTDVALLNGLAKIILDEGWWDREYVASRTEDFEAWAESLAEYTPEVVSTITGVPVADLYRAARAYAKPAGGPGAVVYAMGITQHTSGTNNVLAVANLAMLTGNVGVPGGGVNPLRGQSNVQGACDMGALPDVLPGYQKVMDAGLRSRWEKLWGVALPAQPGLAMTEMMHAIDHGEITAMYILGENPVLSEGDASHVARSLPKLDFLVVQDIFLTETARLADVVLPGASFAEKDGTFTNTERRVQLVRRAVSRPGEARDDWEIVCDVARRVAKRLGQDPSSFAYAGAAAIMDEIATGTPSYGGISHARLAQGGLQWPCPAPDHPGTPVLHVGRFSRGLGRFHAVHYLPPHELPDEEYPLLLTTGRLLYHYHTGSLTRRVAGLEALAPEERVEINPEDAARLEVGDGEPVTVASRRGQVAARARVSDRVPAGTVFMTFHFAESPTNVLTSAALDPVSKIQELKVCAVRVAKREAATPATR